MSDATGPHLSHRQSPLLPSPEAETALGINARLSLNSFSCCHKRWGAPGAVLKAAKGQMPQLTLPDPVFVVVVGALLAHCSSPTSPGPPAAWDPPSCPQTVGRQGSARSPKFTPIPRGEKESIQGIFLPLLHRLVALQLLKAAEETSALQTSSPPFLIPPPLAASVHLKSRWDEECFVLLCLAKYLLPFKWAFNPHVSSFLS